MFWARSRRDVWRTLTVLGCFRIPDSDQNRHTEEYPTNSWFRQKASDSIFFQCTEQLKELFKVRASEELYETKSEGTFEPRTITEAG